jgi:enoyl-CoA hydratase
MTLQLQRGPVWSVTLDRPDHANALSPELVEALHDLLDEAEASPPAALVLRGNARHFAAGFDLSGLQRETDASLAHRFLRIGLLLERLATAPYLTIAVAQGAAIGAGADLVSSCDHRLVAPGVTLRFPGAQFGVVLGVGRRAVIEDYAGLVTGSPDELDAILHGWVALPAEEQAAVLAARPAVDLDAELAALARSVAVPGLRHRLVAYARPVLTKELAPT